MSASVNFITYYTTLWQSTKKFGNQRYNAHVHIITKHSPTCYIEVYFQYEHKNPCEILQPIQCDEKKYCDSQARFNFYVDYLVYWATIHSHLRILQSL